MSNFNKAVNELASNIKTANDIINRNVLNDLIEANESLYQEIIDNPSAKFNPSHKALIGDNLRAFCPFLPEGLCLPPDKMSEIYDYLFGGTNHLCHSDRSDNTVCLGGREWALNAWYSMGIINAPTDEALADAMRRHGVEPKEHING